MTEAMERTDKYLTVIGAMLQDAEQGTSQGLLAMEDIDQFFEQDAQALFGISWEGLKKAGQDLWEKVSPKLYAVFCDPESEEHKALAGMIQPGATEVPGSVVGIIVTKILTFVPAIVAGSIAYFLAKLILEKFFKQAYQIACDAWKKTLPAEEEEKPAEGEPAPA